MQCILSSLLSIDSLLTFNFFLSGEDAENLSLFWPRPRRIQDQLTPLPILQKNFALEFDRSDRQQLNRPLASPGSSILKRLSGWQGAR